MSLPFSLSYYIDRSENVINPNAPHYRPYLPINLPNENIKRLQRFLNVSADGKVGEQTILAMYYYIANSKEYQDIAYASSI